MTLTEAAPSPWAWHPHADIWLAIAGLEAAYLFALRRIGPRYVEPGERPASRAQMTMFSLGVLALWAAVDWPMHELAERYLYLAHMVQHMLLMLIAPALILAGTPHWLARRLLRQAPVMWIARRITRPVPALLFFNAVLVFSHWPVVVDGTLRNEPLHILSHGILSFAGLVMWWPVLSPLPELPRISYPAQMLYLFLQTIVPTVPASFLTFTDTPIYHFYETIPRVFGISVVDDLRVAGLIMKLGGGMILWAVIALLFFRWSGREERPEQPDVLEWQRVERELNRVGGQE
ncbi:MAG: cytochrome c oxidase assembly protein [Actinomycetota bacterium]